MEADVYRSRAQDVRKTIMPLAEIKDVAAVAALANPPTASPGEALVAVTVMPQFGRRY